VRSIAGTRHHVYPVVDRAGVLAGIVTRESLDRAASEGTMEKPMAEIVEPAGYAPRETEPLGLALRGLARHGLTRCPIVSADGSGRVVGFLSPTDIVAARLRASDTDHDDTFS
jgi:CBS domain-containing protein